MALRFIIFLTVLFTGFVHSSAVAAQHEHAGKAPEKLGTVQFATSCSAEAQPQFNRGVALLHSFWFKAAVEQFQATLEKDPKCAMAHWGIALSLWGNPFAPTPPTLRQDHRGGTERGEQGCHSRRGHGA